MQDTGTATKPPDVRAKGQAGDEAARASERRRRASVWNPYFRRIDFHAHPASESERADLQDDAYDGEGLA